MGTKKIRHIMASCCVLLCI